jgi:glycosyltransferase involved in cell wall biosynthesis
MSESSPLVSVITATYNWSSVLRYAIQSVLGQTFQDFELLVIGDGCTDDSAEVVASFGDERIRWRNLEKNSGSQSMPNNAGLEMARGKYVAYHGHDDVWFPTHLALLVKALQENDADLAHSIAVMIGPPESGVRIVTGVFPSGQYTPDLFVPPSSIMHKREVVTHIGDWRDYRTLQIPPDREFVSRVWEHRKRFATVNELTAFKFNSAWRRNSYREKPCHEQAEYVRRIRSEPDFLSRELLAITMACVLGKTQPPIDVKMPDLPEAVPPGWLVEQWRMIRGLEPNELVESRASRGSRFLYKRSKKGLQRILRGLASRLGD